MKYESLCCPLCESELKAPPLHSFDDLQAAAHFCPIARDFDRHSRMRASIKKLWGATTAEVYLCPECGFGFGWPYVGGDEEFYSILHEHAGYPSSRWEYGLTIKQVNREFPDGGKVLDIGAGDGAFLKSLGDKWEKSATEGSETTRATLRAAGITCHRCLAEVVANSEGSFELVTMFQALEHFADFKDVLAGCLSLLKPGGRLVVSVPNGDRLYEQEEITGFPDMIPSHINKFTPGSLSLALRKAGFEPGPALLEPPGVGQAVYRATLVTRAQAAKIPSTLAGKAWSIKKRLLQRSFLAFISAVNLVMRLHRLPKLMRGGTLVVMGIKGRSWSRSAVGRDVAGDHA
jgi:SAM-dependent methyltransferase